MLGLLLGLTIVLMLISIAMTILHIKSEEQSSLWKFWVAVASFGIVFTLGIGFVMIKQLPAATTAESPQASQSPAGNQANQNSQLNEQDKGTAIKSYDFLTAVLEALKNGQPIPQEYLDLLPEADRQKLLNGSGQAKPASNGNSQENSSTESLTGWQSGSIFKGPIQTGTVTASNQGTTAPQSTGQTQQTQQTQSGSSQSSPTQNQSPADGQGSAAATTSNQTVKGTLLNYSPIPKILRQSRDQVRSYFQSLYAQPLQQGADRDLYLTGDLLLEVKYTNNQAASFTVLYENLIPTGKDRGFWETEFRSKIGISDTPATSTAGAVTTWKNVYPGTNQVQFTIDLTNNRGMIQVS